jgi:hypothetical protein
MRTFVRAAVLVVGMVVGAGASAAQMVDPSTGIMVDAATDPMDFSAIMSGQPTNVGLEAALSANAQMQAEMNANVAASDDSVSAPSGSDDAPVVPSLPMTPKPVIAPGGGTFKGSVQVTLADSDAAAVVFFTTDGKKPTTSSTRYAGPIVVTAKTKIQALAFDVNKQPSGLVAKTFKVKS